MSLSYSSAVELHCVTEKWKPQLNLKNYNWNNTVQLCKIEWLDRRSIMMNITWPHFNQSVLVVGIMTNCFADQEPDLQNILRQSYDNAKVTIDLR